MFERFTDRARRAVVLAQEEARLLGHGYVGTEHLLLGLLHDDGPAATALEAHGITLHTLRADVETGVGRTASPPRGHIPFTPRAKEVLEMSLREALQLGHNDIAGTHLLLGLLCVDGRALQLLAGRGVDVTALHDELAEVAATREQPGPLIGSTLAGFSVADLVHEISQLRAEVAALRTMIDQRLPPPNQETPTD